MSIRFVKSSGVNILRAGLWSGVELAAETGMRMFDMNILDVAVCCESLSRRSEFQTFLITS